MRHQITKSRIRIWPRKGLYHRIVSGSEVIIVKRVGKAIIIIMVILIFLASVAKLSNELTDYYVATGTEHLLSTPKPDMDRAQFSRNEEGRAKHHKAIP